MISLKKRVLSVGQRDLISRNDLKLLAMLPLYATVSWCVSEHRWGDIVQRMTSRRRTGPDSTEAGIRSSGLGVGRDPHDVVAQLEKNRVISYLQYLREYRPGGWRMRSRIEGDEAVRKAQADGKGVILWIAHFVFNGLPLKRSLREAGYRVSHLSRPEHGFSSTRFGVKFLNPIRSHVEERYLEERILIKRGSEQVALRKAHKLLQQGKIVSITAGHWEGREVASMPVGSTSLPVSTGAPGLAFVTGSLLLPVFIALQDDGVFKVVIGNKIDVGQCEDRVSAVKRGVEEMSRQLLPHILETPGQWRGWKYLKGPVISDTPA
jgi:hypothetical protein